jgi:hypothetical protein
MNSHKCLIWDTLASISSKSGDYDIVDSARAGGRYKISGSANERVATLDKRQKALLTTVLIEQRRSGDSTPYIDFDMLNQVGSLKELSFARRIEGFFRWLNERKFRLGDSIDVLDGTHGFEMEKQRSFLQAYTEMHDLKEVKPFLILLSQMGYIEIISHNHIAILKPKGFEKLEEIGTSAIDTKQAFIAMWFNAETESAYSLGIKEAVLKSGYEPMRIDQKEHSNKIDDEIISEIRRSRFVIADFTSGFAGEGDDRTLIARGGVYYEAGFAQGMGLPVIWTCREDCLKHIHFDTRQYAHIVWKEPGDLKEQLTKRITAVIGWGPNARV